MSYYSIAPMLKRIKSVYNTDPIAVVAIICALLALAGTALVAVIKLFQM